MVFSVCYAGSQGFCAKGIVETRDRLDAAGTGWRTGIIDLPLTLVDVCSLDLDLLVDC